MNQPDSFQNVFQTAAQIKEYQLKQDRKNYEKLPEFYKTSIFFNESLSNVRNQSFYVKKSSYEALKNLGKVQINRGNFDDASNTYSKSISIFKYIVSSNPKWKTDGGIKDEELTYINDEGNNENEKKLINQMKISSLLNISLCEFYLKNWDESRMACDEVLKLDSNNVKALYRKARSYIDCSSTLMDGYLIAQELLIKAYNLDNKNSEIKITLDKVNEYVQKEKNKEIKKYKSFYKGVEYQNNNNTTNTETNSTDNNSNNNNNIYNEIEKMRKDEKYSGKAQMRMLDLIIEMCYVQLDLYKSQNLKKEIEKMENAIDRAKIYKKDLTNLMELNFDNPTENLKTFCKESDLDIKDPKVQQEFMKVKKDYIDEIDKFYNENLLLMQGKNKENIQLLEELKMKKREIKQNKKDKDKKLKNKDKKDNKSSIYKKLKDKDNNKLIPNKKAFFITFIVLSLCVIMRYIISYYKNKSNYY